MMIMNNPLMTFGLYAASGIHIPDGMPPDQNHGQQ
jgi:hypothetical protein